MMMRTSLTRSEYSDPCNPAVKILHGFSWVIGNADKTPTACVRTPVFVHARVRARARTRAGARLNQLDQLLAKIAAFE
ncbi:hypothetical protein IHE32_07025 [Mycetohabitans rhizoxinica]